jgi:hypothetical protein
MTLVDTFLFSEPHEADVLWVKLNVEDHLFHEWVIVENSYTHQGQYKGHYLNKLILADERFGRFVPKLHVIECDIKPEFQVGGKELFDADAIQIERAQREAALPYLLDRYADRDYVLISDVDECLDTEAKKRRRLLRSKVAPGEDIVLVPRIRYCFDFDNRKLARRCTPLVSIRQLRRDGRLNHYREQWLGTPVIWKHEMVFEYSYCFRRDSIMRKYETFSHVGFEQADLDIALRHNHRNVSEYRVSRYGSRPLDWSSESWFVKRRLNSRNSPAFVREHLAELKTNVVSPDYRLNRMQTYPQFFPKSRITRARRWVVLYSQMYSDVVIRMSREHRLLQAGRRIVSALRRPGRLARINRYLRRRRQKDTART